VSRKKTPDDAQILALAKELVKNVKSEKDLSALTSKLVKMTVDAVLSSEIEEHLGYSKNSSPDHNIGNSRNGSSNKNLIGDRGKVEIDIPRDRNSVIRKSTKKRKIFPYDESALKVVYLAIETAL